MPTAFVLQIQVL